MLSALRQLKILFILIAVFSFSATRCLCSHHFTPPSPESDCCASERCVPESPQSGSESHLPENVPKSDFCCSTLQQLINSNDQRSESQKLSVIARLSLLNTDYASQSFVSTPCSLHSSAEDASQAQASPLPLYLSTHSLRI